MPNHQPPSDLTPMEFARIAKSATEIEADPGFQELIWKHWNRVYEDTLFRDEVYGRWRRSQPHETVVGIIGSHKRPMKEGFVCGVSIGIRAALAQVAMMEKLREVEEESDTEGEPTDEESQESEEGQADSQ